MRREIGTRDINIGEYATGTAKHIVFQHHAFVYRNVVLYAHAIAYFHTRSYVYVLPQGATFANDSTLLHMTEMPYIGALANDNIVVHITAFVYEAVGTT